MTQRRTAVLLMILIAAPISTGVAQVAGLSALSGSWRGGGTIQHQNGLTERIRCDAAYASSGAYQLRLNIRCRGDESAFAVAANLSVSAGDVFGDWTETSRNVHGALRGRFSPGVLQGQVTGSGFAANVVIRFSGNRQDVAIRSAGTEMSSVGIVMTRGR